MPCICQLNNEILDLERSMELLRRAIADKEGPLRVAETRLEQRSRRIDMELCDDVPTAGYVIMVSF